MPAAIRRVLPCCALLGACLLAVSCVGVKGTQTTGDGYRIPSEGQARQAVNEGLAAFNDACVVPNVLDRGETFPVTVVEPDTLQPPVRYQQLLALQEAGLLTNRRESTSGGLMRRTFSLTERGQEVNQEVYEFRGKQASLCYATPRVTRIDSIYAIPDRSPRPVAEVIFQHTLQDVQPWARQGSIRRVFPSVAPIVRRADETERERRTLVETENGWKESRLAGDRVPGKSESRKPGS